MDLLTDKQLATLTRGQLLAHCRELYKNFVMPALDPTEPAEIEEEPDEDSDDDGDSGDGDSGDGGGLQ